MVNIKNIRACDLIGTCKLPPISLEDTFKKLFPEVPEIPAPKMSEILGLVKFGYDTSVIGMFQKIGENKELLNDVIAYLVAVKQVDNFINPHFDEHFHGFNDDIRRLLDLGVGKDDVDVVGVHDIAQLSAQAYAEKEEDNGNFEDCSKIAAATIAAVGGASIVGTSGMTTAVVTAMIASSPELGRMACRRIYPEH